MYDDFKYFFKKFSKCDSAAKAQFFATFEHSFYLIRNLSESSNIVQILVLVELLDNNAQIRDNLCVKLCYNWYLIFFTKFVERTVLLVGNLKNDTSYFSFYRFT